MKNLFLILSILLASATQAFSQSAPYHYLTTASTNSNLVQAGRLSLHDILVVNTTATIYYLKFYDKATAPTCGTDTPKLTIPLAASSSGVATPFSSTLGFYFQLGIGFCVVGGIADTDSSNAATGVAVNIGFAAP
jgi:hypothetical protein